MHKTSFNHHWRVRPQTSPFLEMMGVAAPPTPVTLPHDSLISIPRSPDHRPGGLTGYHGSDIVEYLKTFEAPQGFQNGRVEIEFDGVFRGAMVFVNDSFVGQRPYGYTPFSVRIDRHLNEGKNEIRVECRNHMDSRWYSGLGIYRDTWLLVGGPVHVARNGVRIRTVSAGVEQAVVEVTTRLENDATRLQQVKVVTELLDPEGNVVAREFARLAVRPQDQAVLRQRFTVPQPALWSVDTPALHTCRTRLEPAEGPVETEDTLFGIRTLEWDARRGLQINGETIKLRGGCVHHDNGVLGAATIARAEERRIELLKAAGYNAIRSAHNPISKRMLEACDRLGMLVMDEFTDGWMGSGLGFGYGLELDQWWRRDLTEMLERDFNHPSVILYSIGNEVTDTGNRWDAIRGRDMVDHIKTLDDTRPVTNGINPFMTMLQELKAQAGRSTHDAGGVNSFMRDLEDQAAHFITSNQVTERIEEAMSQLDISGYNYAYARYGIDMELHPQRLLVGTEGVPGKLDEIWKVVLENPQVIGEFSWTAWEYMGEAGLGADKPAEDGFFGRYPWRVSLTGDLGITGERRPISYWRETVWGLRQTPYIAVHRPDTEGTAHLKPALYTWSDSVGSWSWRGFEGQPIKVEVYSDADEVELQLNGQTLGRLPAGKAHRYMAVFETTYTEGELTAVAYQNGQETGRSSLQSAGEDLQLRAEPDRPVIRADDTDLAFIHITLTDQAGVLHMLKDLTLQVTVQGSGILQGLGSHHPASEDNYSSSTCHTFLGQALAVIRPTGPGEIVVRIESETGELAEVTLQAK